MDVSNCSNVSTTGNVTSFEWTPRTIVEMAFFSGFLIISVVGNSSLISIISKRKRYSSSPTFIIIRSMALADLIFTLDYAVYRLATLSTGTWGPGDWGCKLFLYVVYSSAMVSANTLALFSIFRYMALVHPLFTRCHVTARKTFVATIVIWLLILLGNSYVLVLFRSHETLYSHCDVDKDVRSTRGAILIPFMIIPVLIISVFHMLKYRGLQKAVTVKVKILQRTTMDKVSGKIVFAIVCTFVFAWVPWVMCVILEDILEVQMDGIFRIISGLLVYMNSCLNPILYFFLSRKLSKEWICNRKRRNNQSETSEQTNSIKQERF